MNGKRGIGVEGCFGRARVVDTKAMDCKAVDGSRLDSPGIETRVLEDVHVISKF